jgi:hypothetical protein
MAGEIKMATYRIYDNILIKLENVFLDVEIEVDKEITSLLMNYNKLDHQLNDLKEKIEILNSLKRSFELYYDNKDELGSLNRSVFKILCNKHIEQRFLQEKELLLNGYLAQAPRFKLPTIIELNKEYKLRKKLQEAELLSNFLTEDSRFNSHTDELNEANECFNLAIESGATDKLEGSLTLFQLFFEKVVHIYNVDYELAEEFKNFRSEIRSQANNTPLFRAQEINDLCALQALYQHAQAERVKLEQDINKLLYQFVLLQNGKKMILIEIKNISGEIESVLFKKYALKQKIEELRQYKIELNEQKHNFMKDPTVDGYSESLQRLKEVEKRFRRLMMHKNFEKQMVRKSFFLSNKTEMTPKIRDETISYHKTLFLVLHNKHLSAQCKRTLLRLSRPSKLTYTNSGRIFFRRRDEKICSLYKLEESFKKLDC